MKSHCIAAAALAAVLALSGSAQAVYYDLGKNGDNKANISWESVATVETMIGRSVKATGYAYYDEKKGKHEIWIQIPANSFQTGIAMRDEHLASPDWLDAAKYPTIDFKSVSITAVKGKKDQYTIVGDLTIKGKTKRITTKGLAQRLPAIKSLEKRGYVGDIIHLVTKFDVKLADHGINVPEEMLGVKVAGKVSIAFDVFGFTNNDPDRKPVAEIKSSK